MNIPEGYKLVPIYPADDMVSAVIDLGRIDPDDVDSIWSGMIENSPFICESDSSAYDEAKERELFAKWKAYPIQPLNSDGQFDKEYLQREWASWKACAKSRARSAE